MTTKDAHELMREAVDGLAKATAALLTVIENGQATRSWYDVAGYAALMGISRSTVLRQIAAGELAAKKVGAQWRIEVAA